MDISHTDVIALFCYCIVYRQLQDLLVNNVVCIRAKTGSLSATYRGAGA